MSRYIGLRSLIAAVSVDVFDKNFADELAQLDRYDVADHSPKNIEIYASIMRLERIVSWKTGVS